MALWVGEIADAIADAIESGVAGAARQAAFKPAELTKMGMAKSPTLIFSVEAGDTAFTQRRAGVPVAVTTRFTIRVAARLAAPQEVDGVRSAQNLERGILTILSTLIDPSFSRLGVASVSRSFAPGGAVHISAIEADIVHLFTLES